MAAGVSMDRLVSSLGAFFEPAAISAELVAHYWQVMLAHGDDPSLGACVTCKQTRCAEWRWMRNQLLSAGLLDRDSPGPASGRDGTDPDGRRQ
jgi:hypothetical protein